MNEQTNIKEQGAGILKKSKGKIITITGSKESGKVLMEDLNPIEVDFVEAHGARVCLTLGMQVDFYTIGTAPDELLAIAVRPENTTKFGTVQSVAVTNDRGTLIDEGGAVIPFEQNFLSEMGIGIDSLVEYWFDGTEPAICVNPTL